MANCEALHQRWSPSNARLDDCHRYFDENARLRRCIIKWAQELEQGAEELKEKDMEQHGPGGKALGTGTWRYGYEFEGMRQLDKSNSWMSSDAEAWIKY